MLTLEHLGVLIAFAVSLLVVMLMHPQVVKFAIKRKIVDNPDFRKLQRRPIPIMGGVAVFLGLVVGLSVAGFFVNISSLLPIFLAMSIMLCVGVADDVSELSPRLRFIIEIAMTVMMIILTKMSLNDLHGLWGYNALPLWISVPLTVVAVVGMINAINLVDGVDGLSSGFCILGSVGFGLLFFKAGNVPMLALSMLTMGALLPFFFHNVFGEKSKMFIGDGGSLMMGMVMSAYVVVAINSGSSCGDYASENGLGLVAFTLAVMSVPVFDTVRVMAMRIIRGTSPFRPDKTHLHHLFIELGFSHVGTTMSVLILNLIVVLVWFIVFKLGASVDVQFYVVIASSLLVTAGFYKFMRLQITHDTAIFRFAKRVSAKSHYESKKWWVFLQRIVDYKHN